jgi:O-antigen ligase/tetratricopeptide (TPR) repeat protein
MPSGIPDYRSHFRSSGRSGGPSVSLGATALGALLLLLVLASPWPFGGVDMTRFLWPVPIIALACWTWMLGRSSAPSPVAPLAALPILLALGFAAFQLVPLPGDWLAMLSPKSLEHWRDAQSLTQPVTSDHAVSAPISLEPNAGRLQMTWLALGLCVFVLAAQFLRSDLGILGLFGSTALVGSAIAIFAVMQGAQYRGKMFWFFELSTKSTPFGPFINRNHGAAFMNLCLAGAVALLWFILVRKRVEDERDDRWTFASEPLKTRILNSLRHLDGTHILGFAGVVFILGGLVSSASRGAIASAGAGIGAALIAIRLQRRSSHHATPLGLYLVIALLLTASVSFVYLIGAEEKAVARFDALFREPDSGRNSRARHWREMVPAIADFKNVGAGLGSYVHVHRLYTPNNRGFVFEHADNTYLEILVEMGVPGAAAAALFIFACGWSIFVLLRRDNSLLGRALGAGAAYALGTQVLHHAVDFPLYSPANLILFAAWMGAACGRAGRIAELRDEEVRPPRFVVLPLGRWQAASALPTGLLLALGLWSWREAAQQERVEWVVSEHRRHPATVKTTLAQADRWLLELDALAAEQPNRPSLRHRLAERWIDRCRVQAKTAALAANPKQDEKTVWDRSDLGSLYAYIFGAARQGQGAVLEAARKSPPIADNLPRAKEHLKAACQLSPLYAAPRLRLAQMPYLLDSPAKREMLVDQVVKLAPGDAEFMFRVGFLEFHADRRDKVIALWKKSLEVSQLWIRPIFEHCEAWIGLDRTLEEVIPSDPTLLVNIAEQILDGPKREKQRQAAYKRALEVLPESDLSKADRNEIAGRAFLGRGHYGDAARCFEEATSEVKNRPYVWLGLADAYEKLGKYRDASRAVSMAAGLLPARTDLPKRAIDLRGREDDSKKNELPPAKQGQGAPL